MSRRPLKTAFPLVAVLVTATSLLQVVTAVRNLRIVSPLQALTIWDPVVREQTKSRTGDDGEETAVGSAGGKQPFSPLTHRGRFLPKFKAGLEAEAEARKAIGLKRKQRLQEIAAAAGSAGGGGKKESNWASRAASADERLRESEAKAVEKAFDDGVRKFEQQAGKSSVGKPKKKNENAYQFVGVVNSASSEPAITWYARTKPSNANWSVRLVHVNRAAIIKDLFNRGKVDVFARYDNTGKVDPDKNQPIVASKYTVRERSWKNLWNFNPKHFITDSSGMYWRERRLRPGLYTDGNTVYEASYRYRDGRNGMRRLSTFDKYLSSKSISEKQKSKILRRLKEDTPDVVLEG